MEEDSHRVRSSPLQSAGARPKLLHPYAISCTAHPGLLDREAHEIYLAIRSVTNFRTVAKDASHPWTVEDFSVARL